jgi:hypothetical protein
VARSWGTHFVITANATSGGSPLYLRADRTWVPDLAQAHATTSESERDELLAFVKADEFEACDAYAFRADLGPDGPVATTPRERIRAYGPTTPLRRPDRPVGKRLSA